MCTYNLSINDSVMESIRPAFASEEALSRWMQEQMEQLMLQYVANLKSKESGKASLSSRLRGIASAPKDFDYKQELANRYDL